MFNIFKILDDLYYKLHNGFIFKKAFRSVFFPINV